MIQHQYMIFSSIKNFDQNVYVHQCDVPQDYTKMYLVSSVDILGDNHPIPHKKVMFVQVHYLFLDLLEPFTYASFVFSTTINILNLKF